MKNYLTRITILSLSITSLLLIASPSLNAQEQPRPVGKGGQGNTGSSNSQPKVAAAKTVNTGPVATKAKILDKMQEILDDQDKFGQRPSNNPLLADLDNIIQKHSVINHSKVDVINFGPGTVRLNKPDGTFVNLKPNFGVAMTVKSGQIDLVATNDFAQIQLQHLANGSCRFFDGDDQLFTVLKPGAPSKKVGITMGRGLQHYHLEK